MFLISSTFILLLVFPFLDSDGLVYLIFVSQLLMLADQFKRPIGGVGGFIFMSLMFFGIRPLHLLIEGDYDLFTGLFRIDGNIKAVNTSMWWATLAMLAFCSGAALFRFLGESRMKEIWSMNRTLPKSQAATERMARLMLIYQIGTIPVMLALAAGGKALYSSSMGAYAYDIPVPLQSGHVFAIMVILERYLQGKRSEDLLLLCFSGILFLGFTWLMRDVSMFRGFYIAGVMIAGIAVLTRLLTRVSLAWLILPIILLQPIFRTLGEQRYASNDAINSQNLLDQAFNDGAIVHSYWDFYDSRGDINIFDTFAAAMESKPSTRPYLLSWLYIPFHLVPRSLWKSKPKQGILQDISFMNGAPYSPGIAGFLLLDGGRFWMIGCMVVLGYLLAWADLRVLILQHGHLRCCLIAIFAVNSMFLTRFYLWQYFYQVLYAVIPCILFAFLFKRENPGHFARTSQKPLVRLSNGRQSTAHPTR